ncbi:MAG: hypothetical protein U1F43_11750 [Myxococcota bacterium]
MSSTLAQTRPDALDHTMLAARTRYFETNHFGADGGYGDRWVDLKIGPVHVAFPNTAGRVKAVRYHDLHHLATGYATDLRGESEISAWELGAGCKGFAAAWFLNLSAMTVGVALSPRRVFAAFVRGRRSQSLYGLDFEPLLAKTVGEVRAETGLAQVDAEARPATLGDRALFGATALAGGVAALASLAIALVLLPFGVAGLAAQRRAAAAAGGKASAA